MSERPAICQGPVRPGRRSARRACQDSVSVRLRHHQRARADEAHVAEQHIEQLRRLVEREAADHPADAGDPVVVRVLDDGAVVAHLHGGGGLHGAELVELEETPAAPRATLREQHRPARIELDRERDQREQWREREQQHRRADDVERALAEAGGRRERGHVDREQRHPADLVDGARAVEELEEARDDVDGHAGVAADAQRMQQALMMRAGEGDHHAVDLVERDEVLERREPAEVGEVVRARVALLLVVDVAGEREPELGMVEDAVGEPPRDEPRPDDQRALPQGGGAVSGHPRGRPAHTADRRTGDRAEERARSGALDVDQREQAEHRPRDREAREHDPRRLADAAGPRAQVLPRVQPAEERGDRPRDGDDGGQDERLRTLALDDRRR